MHKEHFCTTETPQKITEISRKYHGKSRKITENHGKSRKITEGFFQANHGNSRIPDRGHILVHNYSIYSPMFHFLSYFFEHLPPFGLFTKGVFGARPQKGMGYVAKSFLSALWRGFSGHLASLCFEVLETAKYYIVICFSLLRTLGLHAV